ncbi:hypothetical protein AURDEDRAFT_162304 [Auricularia subglabra TFB-10046 SS5]|nr:hypothetical protein AURDEDRAFT_162304 [Auricularia subglabra TFB-10046 SS5]
MSYSTAEVVQETNNDASVQQLTLGDNKLAALQVALGWRSSIGSLRICGPFRLFKTEASFGS